MPTSPALLDFRQRATSYVLRSGPVATEVLVILHLDGPEAGVQVPGGGALPHETIGEAALREAFEETGAAGLVFGEAIGNTLLAAPEADGKRQVNTYSWLSTSETRDGWDHVVAGHDGDAGLRFRCEFRPVDSAGIDWGLDLFLERAVERWLARMPARTAVACPPPPAPRSPEPLEASHQRTDP